MIHLDTNLLIALLDSSHPHASFAEQLLTKNQPLGCSSLAWMELYSKPVSSQQMELLSEILSGGIFSFDSHQAQISGEWFQKSGCTRKLRFDCGIAAAAFHAQASLATANPDDFQPFIPFGLKIN